MFALLFPGGCFRASETMANGRDRAAESKGARDRKGMVEQTTEGHLETDGTNLLGKLMH